MPADNEPNAQSTAAIATFFLTVGAIIEDASVTAAATGLDAAAVEALAAARHPERCGKPGHHGDRRVARAAFDVADIGPVDPGLVGERFLAPAIGEA